MKECQAEKREAESKGLEGVKNKGLMKECQAEKREAESKGLTKGLKTKG